MSTSSIDKNTSEKYSGDVDVEVVSVRDEATVDAVFGEMHSKGPNYRNVGWIGSLILMLKATIGIGVLGIPYTFQTVGIVPGILLLTFVQAIITWSDFVIGTFKAKHPEIYSISDVGFVLAGRWGEEYFSTVYMIYMVCCSGSAMVGISTALNAVSVHGACTAVFIAVAAILGFLFSSIRTLGRITLLGWIGMASIITAILTLVVAVGIQDRPSDAPQTGPWDKELKLFANPPFHAWMSTIASLVFSTCNSPVFFGVVSEMRDFRLYRRSMFTCQGFVLAFYIAIGTVTYYYCGKYVAFPALGSAGHIMKRVCYGLALPGLIITLTIYLHLPAKYLFVRLFRGSPHLNTNSPTHWMGWLGCTFACSASAYVIASAIPIFSSLISLIGALFAPFMCMIPFGFMWLHDSYRGQENKSAWLKVRAAWAVLVVAIGFFISGAGTYAAVVDIIVSTSKSRPWSCTDNSNSV